MTVYEDNCNNVRGNAKLPSKMADFGACDSYIQRKFFRTVAAAQHRVAPRANHSGVNRSGGVAGFGLFVGIDAHGCLAPVDNILIDDNLDHVGKVGQLEHRIEQYALDN